eukprot:scaffold10373_cov118-Isochrysis_galbana.AAC.15
MCQRLAGIHSQATHKKISIRSASGRMRRDTFLSPGGLALPPFSLPPFTVPPVTYQIRYTRLCAVGRMAGPCALRTTKAVGGGTGVALGMGWGGVGCLYLKEGGRRARGWIRTSSPTLGTKRLALHRGLEHVRVRFDGDDRRDCRRALHSVGVQDESGGGGRTSRGQMKQLASRSLSHTRRATGRGRHLLHVDEHDEARRGGLGGRLRRHSFEGEKTRRVGRRNCGVGWTRCRRRVLRRRRG